MNALCEIPVDTLSKTRNVIVAGDIHGDYASFQRIDKHFNPRKDLMIFLGDYADRGPEGLEVIEGVWKMLREHPSRVYALKGNHEVYTENGRPTFSPCTLREEATAKTGDWTTYFKQTLQSFTATLWLAIIIPDVVLFVHGGVSNKIKSLNDVKTPSKEVIEDILWSDPILGDGEQFNRRGAGVEFGRDVSGKICRKLGVKRIVRSHQPRKAASTPYVEHNGRVITISSTTVYNGKPHILKLSAKDLNNAFDHIEDYVQQLN